MTNGLTLTKDINAGEAVFHLKGRIDTVTSPSLDQEISDAASELSKLTLDFSNVEYISSAGLRVLLMAHKTFETKDGMYITNVNQTVSDVFDITGFSMVFHLE